MRPKGRFVRISTHYIAPGQALPTWPGVIEILDNEIAIDIVDIRG